MSFTTVLNVRFNTDLGKEFRVPRAGSFMQFDDADRVILSAWLDRAATRGIESALDLTIRPWKIVGLDAAFGIFETNRKRASWLIVRHGSEWVLASCADGFVSDVSSSLAEILELIDNELGG